MGWRILVAYPEMSQSARRLSNCLKKAETGVVLNIFNGVLYQFSAYTATVSYRTSA